MFAYRQPRFWRAPRRCVFCGEGGLSLRHLTMTRESRAFFPLRFTDCQNARRYFHFRAGSRRAHLAVGQKQVAVAATMRADRLFDAVSAIPGSGSELWLHRACFTR